MDLITYLKNIYGYDTPIFLKDLRIGRKSKTAIKQELYRACKRGDILRKTDGIYFFRSDKEFGSGITVDRIFESKYIYDSSYAFEDNLCIQGYYSGLTFLNQIGISTQVPAIIEITTNNTSCNKRTVNINGRTAIIRKSKTDVDFRNWEILQFLDMFHFLNMEEVKANEQLLINYINQKSFLRCDLDKYIGLYSFSTVEKLNQGGIIDAFKT